MYAPDFAYSTRRRFREIERSTSDASRVGDLHASWLGQLFLVERARESMLWTWAVARLGGEGGTWGERERSEVRGVFGLDGDRGKEGEATVWVEGFRREKRPGFEWMDLKGRLDEMGVEGPMATELLWCKSSWASTSVLGPC